MALCQRALQRSAGTSATTALVVANTAAAGPLTGTLTLLPKTHPQGVASVGLIGPIIILHVCLVHCDAIATPMRTLMHS